MQWSVTCLATKTGLRAEEKPGVAQNVRQVGRSERSYAGLITIALIRAKSSKGTMGPIANSCSVREILALLCRIAAEFRLKSRRN